MNVHLFAQSKQDITSKVLALYDSLKNNKIEQVQAAKQLNQILKNVDKEIEKDIKQKDFSKAKRKLHIYMLFADALGEKELHSKLTKEWQKIHNSFLDHVNLSKPGIYTDKMKSKIYFIGKIRAPKIKNISMRRSVRDLNIRGESLTMLKKLYGKKWPDLHKGAIFGMNLILIADTSKDGKTITFLYELGSISTKNADITEILKKQLPSLPFK